MFKGNVVTFVKLPTEALHLMDQKLIVSPDLVANHSTSGPREPGLSRFLSHALFSPPLFVTAL